MREALRSEYGPLIETAMQLEETAGRLRRIDDAVESAPGTQTLSRAL